MMYGGEKGVYPARIAFITSVFMTIVSVTPYFFDLDGLHLSLFSFFLILSLGIWFTVKSYQLLTQILLIENC